MVAFVDDADYEAVSQFNWHVKKCGDLVYAHRNLKNPDGVWTTQTLHKFLIPEAVFVDHEDRDGLNDQRYNLRPCTRSQNGGNRKRNKNGSSNFKGVGWHIRIKKWAARIGFNSKRIHIGFFNSEEDAARAYDEAAKKYHGEFARLNFQ